MRTRAVGVAGPGVFREHSLRSATTPGEFWPRRHTQNALAREALQDLVSKRSLRGGSADKATPGAQAGRCAPRPHLPPLHTHPGCRPRFSGEACGHQQSEDWRGESIRLLSFSAQQLFKMLRESSSSAQVLKRLVPGKRARVFVCEGGGSGLGPRRGFF